MPLEILALVLVAAALVIALVSLWSVRKLKSRIAHIEDAPVVARSLTEQHKVGVVLNPSKNDAERALALLRSVCADSGLEEPLVFETTVEDPGHAMAVDALAAGCTLVVAAGGDGTVREVAEVLAGKDAVMGLLPLGTGNLLARNLDFDVEDLPAAVATALGGAPRDIDAVAITLEGADGSLEEHVFLVIAGIGFDADIMNDTNAELKAKVGHMAYAEAAMRHLPGQRSTVQISLDGGPLQSRKVRSVMIANCGKLQGGVELVPDARVDDGLLDVVVMSPRSVAGWLWIAAKTALRSRRRIPIVDYYQARAVRIVLPEPIGSQLDGDTTGEVVALQAQVRPKALRIRVPQPA
ncbi:diacylglycerol/lipid kinase family protein [Zafaria sp. Z1313]|uniref:diacylglycerol/lipid kinase family protein n=1 Tax=unclassified Zafaria TaxID=2828765 RepID=UPI002E76B38B|nr:diacylglycerol kinase family protein [Zafaria sp. J156]MEE1621419.1 diacylglycerol kinase family protein [Zafaria sp. J156]